jgi:RNA polymerase sigma factor (sigma-70 family)
MDDDRSWVKGALERYEQPLLRFAASFVGRELAADVVQDAFVALCKANRDQVEGHLAAWLFTVCKHRALDVRRDQGRLAETAEDEGMESPDSGPMTRAERHESMSRVLDCLERLGERERQIVILKFSAGLKYKEIADVMQLSVSNVGVILHTAIKTIRDELGADSASEPRVARSLP